MSPRPWPVAKALHKGLIRLPRRVRRNRRWPALVARLKKNVNTSCA